jgi:ribonuclease HI
MARWITGLPIAAKTENLLTCAHLPPLDAYLDSLTAAYAVRQYFLPIDHTVNTIPRIQDNPRRLTLPGLPTILNSIRSIPCGRLEDRSNRDTNDNFIPQILAPVHTSKTENSSKTHLDWIKTLADLTIVAYTDWSKLRNPRTGAGWEIFCIGNGRERLIVKRHCTLGTQLEAYDTELHTISEALLAIPHIDAPATAIYICIDNTSAIEALRFNKYNSEPGRQAIKTACTLLETGWQISTAWTPSHSNILGNELADKMAKKRAENNGNECSRSFTSKA